MMTEPQPMPKPEVLLVASESRVLNSAAHAAPATEVLAVKYHVNRPSLSELFGLILTALVIVAGALAVAFPLR
jgi:hypothetical protein